RRVDHLMATQQPIAFAHTKALVGKELEVVVERQSEEGVPVGRSIYDAPEIDPVVYLQAGDLAPGELVKARVLKGVGYDLIAEVEGGSKTVTAKPRKRRLPLAKG
ncbi:MAG TPA: 30S ribosomal protein S12 methylthiotransferase RimO, partial [Planctomycetota bacterium]|nr:30S ribosomal protein S12 methylthiotransferase RimO [Planctomycetota bacterium]